MRQVALDFYRVLPVLQMGWLAADPGPGVEVDLDQLWLAHDPWTLPGCWEGLEKAFGMGARAKDSGFRLYLCPTIYWSRPWRLPRPCPLQGSRAELAAYLPEEA